MNQNIVDAVSSSFGACELLYFPKFNNGQDERDVVRNLHELFLQGNAQGISFLASSGDEAGLECPTLKYANGGNSKFVKGVSTPASDPNVTAVGGTNLVTNVTAGSLDSSYSTENAWSDPEVPYDPYQTGGLLRGGVWGAGGGYSHLWKLPEFQNGFPTGSTKWRALPDVGMQVGGCPKNLAQINKTPPYCTGGNNPKNGNGNADRSAVEVAVNVGLGGGFGGFIGTSVASPEFLSVVALLIEAHGNNRLGNLNDYIYSLAKGQASGGPAFYHTGIPGYNGLVNTLLAPSYSLSTGVGTPVVNSFLIETSVPAAGVPQTPSNP
ncbi:MAG: S8 family serine peptidase [Rhodospirillales bacterium]